MRYLECVRLQLFLNLFRSFSVAYSYRRGFGRKDGPRTSWMAACAPPDPQLDVHGLSSPTENPLVRFADSRSGEQKRVFYEQVTGVKGLFFIFPS